MTELRITDVMPETSSELLIDEYVLFIYENMPYPSHDPIYWEAGNHRGFGDDIFTVKIDPESGRIYRISVIINPPDILPVHEAFKINNIVEGLPIVDTGEFAENFIETNLPIYLYRYDDEFIVSINDLVTPTKCIQNGRSKFYLRDEKLVGIGFCDLTADEVQIIETKMNQPNN